MASIYNQDDNPIIRPYFNNKPAINLYSLYDDVLGVLDIELWDKGKRFQLELLHEYNYPLDKHEREELVSGISKYEKDKHLDQYVHLFGNLEHFTRRIKT